MICQMILLHKRRISYCWVFSHSMPILLGVEYMKNIIAIMTDGHSNKMEKLEKAITSYLPDCTCLRCGWHLIHKGYQQRVPFDASVSKRFCKSYQLFPHIVKNWCYTFMRLGFCETREELRVSKCILLAYIHSRHI